MSMSMMQCAHPNCDRCMAMPKMIQAGPQNARPKAQAPSIFKSLFKREKRAAAAEEDDGILDAKYAFVSDEREEYVRATFVVEGGEKFVCRRNAIKRVQAVAL